MNVFLDTSVLVAAVVEKHENHAHCFAVLDNVQNGKHEGYVSGHSLAEMYAVLTRSPPPFRHSPEQALLSIEENVVKHFKVVSLAGSEYAALVREAALSNVHGGTIYDAVLLKCAMKSGADKIFTLNVRHFQNMAPKDLLSKILAP
jgi:predicted nucleic acid-binding protein